MLITRTLPSDLVVIKHPIMLFGPRLLRLEMTNRGREHVFTVHLLLKFPHDVVVIGRILFKEVLQEITRLQTGSEGHEFDFVCSTRDGDGFSVKLGEFSLQAFFGTLLNAE